MAPAGVPEIRPVTGWPVAAEKMPDKTHPLTAYLPALLDQFCAKVGFQTTFATKRCR